MITLKTASIKAACGMAAKIDIRYYLNGVQILVRDDGDVHVRATDGNLAFDDLMPEKSALAPLNIIIPLAVAKLIAKSKSAMVTLSISGDGRYECAGTIFNPIDGKFPDVDRVMPRRDSASDGEVNQFNAELLARCQIAMRTATGKSRAFFRVQHGKCALVHRENDTYPRCAVMPLNVNKAFREN